MSLTIDDRGHRYSVVVLGVPDFPRHLEDKLRVRIESGPEREDAAFLKWWGPACGTRGFIHGRVPLAEDWVHARRLLTKYPIEELKTLAVEYFAAFARPEWRGAQLLRMFWTLLPEVEEHRKRHG